VYNVGAFLIHSSLEGSGRDFVLFDDVYDGAPSAGGVSVGGVEQRLRRRFEQSVGVHIRFPKRLAHPVKLLRASTRYHEILRLHRATDKIQGTDEGFVRLGLQTGDDGFDEVRAESSLVQQIGNHRHEGLGLDVPVLPERVQLQAEFQPIVNGLDIGGEAGETDVEFGSHFKDFGKVHSDRLELDSVAEIRGDRDAVFPGHRDAGTAVVRHDTHDHGFGWG